MSNPVKIQYISTLLVALLMISGVTRGQNMLSLANDSQISTGTLANGVTYYLITNTRQSGLTDVALVQKAGTDDEPDNHKGESIVQARTSLNELSHFSMDSPYVFLSDNAIWPDENGWAKVSEDATIYRFSRLNESRTPGIVDSTLLMVFDIIGCGTESMYGRYTTENQAVIVAGDIDAPTILNKMNMLSLLVILKEGETQKRDYTWSERERPDYIAKPAVADNMASISASYSSRRTSPENMKTILPLITSLYYSELSVILRKRLEQAFHERQIPLAGVSFDYKSSASGPGDESYSVTISTSRERLEDAVELLSSVLADIDSHGVQTGEYNDTAIEVSVSMTERGRRENVSNLYYVNTCIASFLYGASLASPQSNIEFFSKRALDRSMATELFNNYVSAVLDRDKNLTLTCAATDAAEVETAIRSAFSSAWDAETALESGHAYKSNAGDTLSLKASPPKLKIKSESTEPVSGGSLWIFSNGLRVVYKQAEAAGNVLQYSWVINEGYSYTKGITGGEGAYLADMLDLYGAGGLSSGDFKAMLRANGIKMQANVTLSDFIIRGYAPNSRLELLLKSLIGLAGKRKFDPSAFEHYLECETLRLASRPHNMEEYGKVMVDSLMNPGLDYTPYKNARYLKVGLQKKADNFYDSAFSRMNNGVLIIVGNLDETSLKKVLCRYLGAFSTDKATTYRSRIKSKNVKGRTSMTEVGSTPMISMTVFTPLYQSAENFMTGYVAGLALQDVVARAAAKYGWTARGNPAFNMFPEETFRVDFNIKQIPAEGLPASLMPTDSVELVLSAVREAIDEIADTGVDAGTVTGGRTVVTSTLKRWSEEPGMVRSLLELRYAYGKDILTNYSDKAKSVTVASVNAVLKSLAGGSIAEFVVRKATAGEEIEEAVQDSPAWPAIPGMTPASNFTYPFGDMVVPLDTIDITELMDIPPAFSAPEDAVTIGYSLGAGDSSAVFHKQHDLLKAASDSVEVAETELPGPVMAIEEGAPYGGPPGETGERDEDDKAAKSSIMKEEDVG